MHYNSSKYNYETDLITASDNKDHTGFLNFLDHIVLGLFLNLVNALKVMCQYHLTTIKTLTVSNCNKWYEIPLSYIFENSLV